MEPLPKKELRAVHDENLVQFLDRLGLLSAVREQQLRCASCDSVITLDNFGAAYPDDNHIGVVCDKLECVAPVLKRMKP